MTKLTIGKTYAFIDGQNLYRSIQDQGWQLHYGRFRRFLSDKYGVSRAFYFIGYVSGQRNLYESLRKSGYKLRFKPTSLNKKGERKGNVDAEMIMVAMAQRFNYDQAIIVAGDGDYYCLAKFLKRQGQLHKIIIPDRTIFPGYSGDLSRVSCSSMECGKSSNTVGRKKRERHRLRTEPFG